MDKGYLALELELVQEQIEHYKLMLENLQEKRAYIRQMFDSLEYGSEE